MKTNRYVCGLLTAAVLLAACSEERYMVDGDSGDESLQLRLQAQIEQVNVSRADDSGFADGDKIGIFAVNYNGSSPGELLPQGNQATNVQFTYDKASQSWTGTRTLYFKDNKTKIDVYGLYPYQSKIDNVEEMPFNVERNQAYAPDGGMGAYESSDLLWGKTAGASPENPFVNVTFRHVLSGVKITLVEGKGFDSDEWMSLDKSVYVGGTRRSATVNIKNGTVTPIGEDDGRFITSMVRNDEFRAVVIPQTVDAGAPLISINVGEQTYTFRRPAAMTYVPSKLHKFTIEVNKDTNSGKYEFGLVDEAIVAWESDLESHTGDVRAYINLTVDEFGGLEAAVKEAGLNLEKVVNLKISGRLNDEDFGYLRQNMPYLEAVNIQNVTVRGELWDVYYRMDNEYAHEVYDKYHGKDYTLPYSAFADLKYLRHVVLPAKLKAIGNTVFYNTSLSGAVNLPEGLEFIGPGAFGCVYAENNRKSYTGKLNIPSTVIYIWDEAFSETDFTGELILPAGLRYLGGGAFDRCAYFTGELHLPHTLEYIGGAAFERVVGLSGELVYPHHETVVRQIARDTKIDRVVLPEHPLEFAWGAFGGVPLRGDFTIPSSVTKLGNEALNNTKLSHIYFPADLDVDIIPDGFMQNNKFLIDTISFPEKVEFISRTVLAGCDKLDAVIIPKRVIGIGADAFNGCSSLTYIRCDAVEPPEVPESAFIGINKDNFTLEVPEQSVDAYRTAPVWREFKRISAYKNFVARPLKYNVLNKGGERPIVLNTDADWEVAEIPSWCHLDKTSGSKKTELKLTIDPLAHNAGDRKAKIVFRLKGDAQYTCSVSVGQYDYEYDEDSYVTFQTATKGKGINVFFVGDGYDATDISGGKFINDMRQEMEYLFGVEPYATYREYFNVYCGIALSDDSGIEDINHWRNTKFHTIISNSDTRLQTDYVKAMDYAANVCPPLTQGAPQAGVILVCNTPMYEGITYSIGDSFCSVVTLSENDYPSDARGLIQHEAGGHGFGWLADEYVYHNTYIGKCPCICCKHSESLLAAQSWGYGRNVSLKGRFKEVPWYHLITNPKYSDIVDVYEGGFFHSKGVYRSEYNSCMNNNVPYYSTWSRQLIVERIMKLAGEDFSLERFYGNDKRDASYIYSAPSRSGGAFSAPAKHGQPPVFVTDYHFGKKGGKR